MRRSTPIIAALVATMVAVPVFAVGTGTVDRSSTANEVAERVSTSIDVVTIYNVGALDGDVASRAAAASQAAGGTSAIGRSASTGMQRVWRGSALVQQAPSGWAFPMGTTVLPTELVGQIMGVDVAAALSATDIVMSRRTADLRGARAGDAVDLVASSGAVVQFNVRAVVDDQITGGTELLLSPAAADRLGIARLSRIVLWGFSSRNDIDAQMAAYALVDTSIRIRRSWDPADPDSTLGMSQTKEALGEFSYYVNPSSGAVSIDSAWRSTNITSGSIGQLNLRSGCHRSVRTSLENAMAEVISAGLEYTINYSDANRYGGCYTPRFSRLAPNSSIGFLSRHTWGMAVDTNTQGSCQGCAPPDMDCRTVRIFRRHGFAWGGNFLRPDGMHFEWVGEPRDTLLYPSRFCPNIAVSGALQRDQPTERATLFADDGLIADG